MTTARWCSDQSTLVQCPQHASEMTTARWCNGQPYEASASHERGGERRGVRVGTCPVGTAAEGPSASPVSVSSDGATLRKARHSILAGHCLESSTISCVCASEGGAAVRVTSCGLQSAASLFLAFSCRTREATFARVKRGKRGSRGSAARLAVARGRHMGWLAVAHLLKTARAARLARAVHRLYKSGCIGKGPRESKIRGGKRGRPGWPRRGRRRAVLRRQGGAPCADP